MAGERPQARGVGVVDLARKEPKERERLIAIERDT
jgi:hypothetical protein